MLGRVLAPLLLAACGAAAAPASAPAVAASPTAARAAVAAPAQGIPAFQGAEGFGALARGGRGGDVYHVTSLADVGPGTLRNGITGATGPRTIVFDVAGTIDLTSKLTISRPYLTVAGQTAPGGGITIRGWTTSVSKTHDVVIRYVRFRPGDVACPKMQDDALDVVDSQDVILDHVSASWSIDEALSLTRSDRVTVQWSIISESLRDSCHEKGPHGYGSLLRYGNGHYTLHHNLYAHNDSRNPRIGDDLTVDFVNNVLYDWGNMPGYSGEPDEGTSHSNFVGNYAVAGPSTPANKRGVLFIGGSAKTQIYQAGNVIDSNHNAVRDGADTGWAMFTSAYTKQEQRFEAPGVQTDDAATAYTRVLAGVGASRVRDAVDQRILADVVAETGGLIDSPKQVGGWPALETAPAPKDGDQDGMPDEWEAANGLNPADPADRNRDAGGGYTFLERYLDSLAARR